MEKDLKTDKIAKLILESAENKPTRMLVVGCGSGLEAAILAKSINTKVIGIDIQNNFNTQATLFAQLEIGNAQHLRFEDNYFDFIYSYHALEHIAEPKKALLEMKRVLKKGGGYFIGTPNRHRLFGYLGSKNATLHQKLQWNITDWKKKLVGEFRNELGAHAGYTAFELGTLLDNVFENNNNFTHAYFKKMYKNKWPLRLFLNVLIFSQLSNIIYPSVYFMGSK